MSLLDVSRPSPLDVYYDVFLSFRGPDTRKGFTTNLYHALQQNEIHSFMDEDLVGEEIDHLFKVIEKSRMGVVIYSEHFASSEWCLRELETILQRRKDNKILMIPIFYKVDLTELKHLTGKTAQYLDEHIAEFGEKTVQAWKVAVKKLSGVSGISYKEFEHRSEYDFIKYVIDRIKKKLKAGCDSTQERSTKSSKTNKLHSPIPKPPEEAPPTAEPPKPVEEKKPEPQVITMVLKVHMHCEACAQEIKKHILRMKGVEEVITDCKSHKVVVKGEKADPLKVLQMIKKKIHRHRQVELLSPIPKPPEEAPPTVEPPKPVDEKKPEPQVITVVLKVHMHCEACAQEIKKRILRMKGIESAEADWKSSEVAVKGTMEPQKLLEYVYEKTGKHVVIVKQDPPPPSENKPAEEPTYPPPEDKKSSAGEGEKKVDQEGGGDENKDSSAKKGEAESNADSSSKGIGDGESVEENKVIGVLKKGEAESNADSSSKGVREGESVEEKKVTGVLKKGEAESNAVSSSKGVREGESVEENKVVGVLKKGEAESNADSSSKGVGEGESVEENKVVGVLKKREAESNADSSSKGVGDGESVEEKADVLKKNDYYYFPHYAQKSVDYLHPMTYHPPAAYPPQIFSDENPNACSVM